MIPEISLLFDLVVAAMLVVMIFYAWRLNEKLGRLQNDKVALERLLASFNDSTERAEAGIARLKQNATETVKVLDDKVIKAVTLRDELAFMIDRSNEMADRLETSISAGRAPEGGAKSMVPSRDRAPVRAETEQPAAEEDSDRRRKRTDLLKALEGMR